MISRGLDFKKTVYRVTTTWWTAIEDVQKNLAQIKPITEKRPGDEDFVIIDYEGLKDGEPFEATKKTENFTMKIGGVPFRKSLMRSRE